MYNNCKHLNKKNKGMIYCIDCGTNIIYKAFKDEKECICNDDRGGRCFKWGHFSNCPCYKEPEEEPILKTFHITSTINIEAESREDAQTRLDYNPERYMDDLYDNAEIDEEL